MNTSLKLIVGLALVAHLHPIAPAYADLIAVDDTRPGLPAYRADAESRARAELDRQAMLQRPGPIEEPVWAPPPLARPSPPSGGIPLPPEPEPLPADPPIDNSLIDTPPAREPLDDPRPDPSLEPIV